MCCLSVRYYTYAGSLTTPGCNEGVKWHVMATECVVPREFMSFVRTFSSMEGNYRDVMPLGEREIFGAGKFFCLKLMKLPFTSVQLSARQAKSAPIVTFIICDLYVENFKVYIQTHKTS